MKLCIIFILILESCKPNLIRSNDSLPNSQINDSLQLDSLLYKDKFVLTEIAFAEGFSYNLSYNIQSKVITAIAKNEVKNHQIRYDINLQYNYDSFVGDKFHFYDEASYLYINSKFEINKKQIDLRGVSFINEEDRKLFPAGIWMNFEGEPTIKYYKYYGKEYLLLNGQDLFCNGSHCSSFQLYIIVINGDEIQVNPFLLSGVWPYLYTNIKLVDLEKDGLPDIYILKSEKAEIRSINDFDIYGINEIGKAFLKSK